MTVRGIKPIVRAELAAMPHGPDGNGALLAIEEATTPCPYCGGSRFRCCEYARDRAVPASKENDSPRVLSGTAGQPGAGLSRQSDPAGRPAEHTKPPGKVARMADGPVCPVPCSVRASWPACGPWAYDADGYAVCATCGFRDRTELDSSPASRKQGRA